MKKRQVPPKGSRCWICGGCDAIDDMVYAYCRNCHQPVCDRDIIFYRPSRRHVYRIWCRECVGAIVRADQA